MTIITRSSSTVPALRIIGAVCLLAATGCAQSSPTTPWWEGGSTMVGRPIAIVNLSTQPRAVNGGGSSQGLVTLSQPVPTATVVALASSDSVATVPPSITVPSGATVAPFTVTTRVVSQDSGATITGSISGQSWKTFLSIWTIVPNSFAYESDPTAGVFSGRIEHFTESDSLISAACSDSSISVQTVKRDRSRDATGVFSVPRGSPFLPGSYEGGSLADATRPSMSVSGDGVGCFVQTSRFVVEEAEMNASGDIHRLVLTFEQQCQGVAGRLRGEIRLTNPVTAGPGASPRRCIR